MPAYCCAGECTNRHEKNKNLSFHSLPINNEPLLQLWLKKMRRDKKYFNPKSAKICSDHFHESDFMYFDTLRRTLLKNAVPSIFAWNKTYKGDPDQEDKKEKGKQDLNDNLHKDNRRKKDVLDNGSSGNRNVRRLKQCDSANNGNWLQLMREGKFNKYRKYKSNARNRKILIPLSEVTMSELDTDSSPEADDNVPNVEITSSSGAEKTIAQVTPSPAVTSATSRAMSSTSPSYEFETLKVSSTGEFIKHVELNRPSKLNAMNTAFWQDMIDCFTRLSHDPDCRVIILSGAGKMFTAGLDFKDAEALEIPMMDKDPGYKAFAMNRHLQHLQNSFTVVEKCNKPVIAAIHNGCIGGGIDLTCCCDMRYCTEDAWFTIKEVDLGLAADLGTLSRLPKITGNDSLCRELVYTGRKFDAKEAQTLGFVSRIFPNKATMMAACEVIAAGIANKSPVAVQGSKHLMVYSRDHTVQEGLDYTTVWNSAMLQSEDCKKAMMAMMSKEKPSFSKL